MSSYRIMMYCQDSLGLGHLRRATNIAWSVNRIDPLAELLIVADSPVAPFFPIPPTCDVVKLPTLVKVDAGQWKSPLDEVFDLDGVRRLRVDLLQSIATEFRPDAILIDHMAQGAMGELAATIGAVRQRQGAHIVLGLRDILGDPEAIRAQWELDRVPELIAQSYDQILVYGVKDMFDLPVAHQFDEVMRSKTTFCGYVVQEFDERRKSSDIGPTSVLVMAGGGHDGDRMMSATVDALDHIGAGAELSVTIMTGPFLDSEQADALKRRASGSRIEFKPTQTLSMADVDAAELVVSMCGYNTMAEVLALKKPAVVVPRLGPSLEQTIRARLFAERGLIHSVADEEISPEHFARCIEAELNTSASSRITLPTNGGAAAAIALLQREPEASVVGA